MLSDTLKRLVKKSISKLQGNIFFFSITSNPAKFSTHRFLSLPMLCQLYFPQCECRKLNAVYMNNKFKNKKEIRKNKKFI